MKITRGIFTGRGRELAHAPFPTLFAGGKNCTNI